MLFRSSGADFCRPDNSLMAAAFTVVMLSSIGLPGLNGFVGEFLILLGTFASHRWWAVVAAAGVILAALYLLWAYQRVFHGTADREENAKFADLKLSEGLSLLPLIALIVFLGVYPKLMIERIEPSVDRLLTHVALNVPGFSENQGSESERGTAEDLTRAAEAAEEAAAEAAEDVAAHGGESGGEGK